MNTRKYIYILFSISIIQILLLLFLFLPTIAQAGNVKTGAQLVQELCQQANYVFCGSSFSTNRRTSQYGYVTARDAGTSVKSVSSQVKTLVRSATCRGACVVYCPSYTKVVGGGCQNVGDTRMWNRVYGNGWLCGATDRSVRTVYAVCAY